MGRPKSEEKSEPSSHATQHRISGAPQEAHTYPVTRFLSLQHQIANQNETLSVRKYEASEAIETLAASQDFHCLIIIQQLSKVARAIFSHA